MNKKQHLSYLVMITLSAVCGLHGLITLVAGGEFSQTIALQGTMFAVGACVIQALRDKTTK